MNLELVLIQHFCLKSLSLGLGLLNFLPLYLRKREHKHIQIGKNHPPLVSVRCPHIELSYVRKNRDPTTDLLKQAKLVRVGHKWPA